MRLDSEIDNILYIGLTLYDNQNSKCKIIGVSDDTIKVERIRDIQVTSNDGKDIEICENKEKCLFNISDIGSCLFFNKNDNILPIEELKKINQYKIF